MGKVISIDIGTDSIKIVEADKQLKSVKVYKTVTIATPEQAVDDGLIRNKDLIVDLIKNTLITNKIKTKSVIFTITSSKIVTREVVIPYVAQNKLKDIIALNSSEYFPFSLTDYIVDHKVVDVIKDGNKRELKVYIAAAPVSLMADYSELASLLKLNLTALDYVGNSIYQLAKRQQIKGNYITIGLGTQSTLVTIMENDKLAIQRFTTNGTDELYRAVMSRYGISKEEAVNMLFSKPLLTKVDSAAEDFRDEVMGAMNLLVSSISRIIDFYKSRNQNMDFERIYLYGNGIQIMEINNVIKNRFNIDTVVTNKFENVIFQNNDRSEGNPIIYMSAIGAIFEPYDLKPEIDANGLSKADLRFYGVLGGIVVVAIAACFLLPTLKKSSLTKKKENLETKIEQIKEIDDVVREKENLVKKIKFREEIVSISSSYTDDILDVLRSMEDNMPINTVFVSMNVNLDGIVFSTRVEDMGTLAKLIQQMKKVPYFSDVVTTGFSLAENVDVYKVSVNEAGETVKTTIGTVDLYDVVLNCFFKTPYVSIDKLEEN